MKFVQAGNNFRKLAEVRKNFTKFVTFTRSNIFLGKHKCFVNTFHKYIVVVTYE